MTGVRDVEDAAVRDAYLEETEPKQRARGLARADIGAAHESTLPAHNGRPYGVIVRRGRVVRHHRFAYGTQARDFHRLLTARRDAERELALDQADAQETHE